MWFKKKKTVPAFNGKRFVVAYSDIPFQEAPSGETLNTYHDYAFYKRDGLYWCVRVGEIKGQWGIGRADGVPFYANGTFIFKRKNQSVDGWDGKDFHYTLENGVFRLYEKELVNERFEGFTVDLWAFLKPFFINIAKDTTAETFTTAIAECKREMSKALTDKYDLTLDGVEIEQLGNYKEI